MSDLFEQLSGQARMGLADFSNVSLQACVEASRERYRARWNALRIRHQNGESGASILRANSEDADELLRGIIHFAIRHSGVPDGILQKVAFCALGGYGRRELSPCSDLDIVLLHDGVSADAIQKLNRCLVPFLWDVGFKAGFATHSVKEATELATKDPEVFTTYMQARLVLGDGVVFARMKMALDKLAAHASAEVLKRLREREHPDRLQPDFRDLHAPEPNIKESIGGLRDYHAGLWMIWLRHGGSTLEDLVTRGLLLPEEHVETLEGLDFLWRVRNEIHFHTRKPDNQLTFALQKHVAHALGYGSEDHGAIDRLMQDYYIAAQRVRRFLRYADRICDQRSEVDLHPETNTHLNFVISEGELRAGYSDPHWFAEHPPRLMEVFWNCARRGVRLDNATERRVRTNLHLVNDAFRSHDLVRSFFLGICRRPLEAGRVFRQMAETGLLAAYLPEFSGIQGIVRYEDFHSYPVDEHTLRAIENLAEIPRMSDGIGALFQRVLEHLRDPQVLVLAILAHDLGKAGGEEHVEEGVRLVQILGDRMGLSQDFTQRVAFLVRHHMLMTEVSMYRDSDDPEIVHRFAQTMGGEEPLRELLLLSYCDLRAVGPNVWTEWKGALLVKLFLKAERLLGGGTIDSDEAVWDHPKVREVEALVQDTERPQLVRYLRGLGERYLFAFPALSIIDQFRCVQEAQTTGLAVHASTHEDTNITEFVVCTRDRPGLFADISGCFASQLADVRSAAIFTTPEGHVVDVFTLTDAARRQPLTKGQQESILKVLRSVLLDGEDVQPFVEQSRRRLFALPQPRVPVRTRVEFDNDASRTDTVIDVETGDRTGLLFDMARAMAAMGLEVRTAKIVTDARRVRDAFYVRRGENRLETEYDQEGVRQRLLDAISGAVPVEVKGDR